MTASEKLQKACTKLVLDHPFFAGIVLQYPLVEDASKKTVATNGIVIKYNPDYVMSLTEGECETLMVHEGDHNNAEHPVRRCGREFKLWNIACDHVINLTLTDAGFAPIKGWFCDERFRGMNAEQVYAILDAERKQQEEEEQKKSEEEKGEENKDDNKSDESNETDGQQPDEKESESDNSESGSGEEEGTDEGEGSGEKTSQEAEGAEGKAEGAEGNGLPSEDFGGCGEVEDLPSNEDPTKPASEDEIEKWKQDNREATFEAAQIARQAGSVPDYLKDTIENILNPKVPWISILRDYFTKNCQDEYNWQMPDEERVGFDKMYMPTLNSENIRKVIIGVDTSGSCWKWKDTFASEISSLLSEIDTEITIKYFDTRVANVQEFTSADLPLKLEFRGGGGTAFTPIIESCKDEDFSLLIIFTDLECYDYPKVEPDYSVIWIKTPDGHGANPPFGEVIQMN